MKKLFIVVVALLVCGSVKAGEVTAQEVGALFANATPKPGVAAKSTIQYDVDASSIQGRLHKHDHFRYDNRNRSCTQESSYYRIQKVLSAAKSVTPLRMGDEYTVGSIRAEALTAGRFVNEHGNLRLTAGYHDTPKKPFLRTNFTYESSSLTLLSKGLIAAAAVVVTVLIGKYIRNRRADQNKKLQKA